MYDPGPIPARDVLALVNEIPRAFFRLSAIADELFADLGVGGPERGVLRDLFVEGEGAAPDFARRKAVSRQAMQTVLDNLVEKGLVRTEINPRHKRSKHYVLTRAGIDTCVELQRRELEKISTLMKSAPPADFGAAAAAVAALNAILAADLDRRR